MGLSAVLSGLGAVKSLFGGDPAQGYYDQAAQSLKQKNQLLALMSQLAQQYDPHQATQDAVNYASQTASKTLGNTLSGLDQQYQAGGGDPTGDTRFRVSAQGATDRALDPLKQFAADRSANELMSKLQAMQMAAGADTGQVANSYLQMANANKQSQSGALGTLGSSLTSIFQHKVGGTTGTGKTGGGAAGAGTAPVPTGETSGGTWGDTNFEGGDGTMGGGVIDVSGAYPNPQLRRMSVFNRNG